MRKQRRFNDSTSHPIKIKKAVEQNIEEKRGQNETSDAEKVELVVQKCLEEHLSRSYAYLNLKTFQVREIYVYH